MANPFQRMQVKESTAPQFVYRSQFGREQQKNWSLENAVVQGYYASGWVYSCASILARHVASVPWRVWETTSSGDLKVIPGHNLEYLIRHPNEHQTGRFQMYLATLHLCLAGNALQKIVTVGRKNEPSELWPLQPDSTYPIPDRREWLKEFVIKDKAGVIIDRLDPAVVCHSQIANPSDPYWGQPPIRAISRLIDMDVAQVEWNRHLIENDATPSGVFIDPNIIQEGDMKAVKQALQRLAGPLHAREPLVLSAGSKWEQMGIPPRELDWVSSRKFTVGEICTALGLLTARFSNDAATYNNLFQAIRYEWENGALPLAEEVGDGLGLRLLTLEERRRGMLIRPDTSSVPVLQDDIHKAAESFERFVRNMVPPQTAASLLNIAVGDIPHGYTSFKPATLEPVASSSDLDEDDL